MRAWCSGLPGILLSRCGILRTSKDDRILAEIEAGVLHLPELMGLDHWCCGNTGIVETLIYASTVLNRQDLANRADSMLDRTIRRALKSAYFRFSPYLGENYCFQPSLFRGLGGIIYTLLRRLEPNSLPSILTFELVNTTGRAKL
jgi:lantibiotic modifying enzyme